MAVSQTVLWHRAIVTSEELAQSTYIESYLDEASTFTLCLTLQAQHSLINEPPCHTLVWGMS